MATIRPGSQAAVVEAQGGGVASAERRSAVLANVNTALDRARQAQVPVVWVQHSNQELAEGSAVWQIVPELAPAPDETIVAKRYNSAFEETELEDHLCGAATNWCIRATAYAAIERGYDVPPAPGRILRAADVTADLNTVFTWLE